VRTSSPWRSSGAGYYRDENATEYAFREGWFHSGDSCVYDSHGLRIMVDRYKDIVKSAGRTFPACGWKPYCTSTRWRKVLKYKLRRLYADVYQAAANGP
jgi:hypothetical protein